MALPFSKCLSHDYAISQKHHMEERQTISTADPHLIPMIVRVELGYGLGINNKVSRLTRIPNEGLLSWDPLMPTECRK